MNIPPFHLGSAPYGYGSTSASASASAPASEGQPAPSESSRDTQQERPAHRGGYRISAGIRRMLQLGPSRSSSAKDIDDYAHPQLSKRKYLTYTELGRMMLSGNEAKARSGLVLGHIDALKEVSRELATVLAFRKVNPNSKFWIKYGSSVKGLGVKDKSEQEGPYGGLLVRKTGGRKESTVSSLDASVLATRIYSLIEEGTLEILEEEPGDGDSTPKVITVREIPKNSTEEHKKDRTYRFELNETRKRFIVYKKDGDDFKIVTFKGIDGVPLTADYDAFDLYPRLRQKKFAGFKDIRDPAVKGGLKAIVQREIDLIRLNERSPEVQREARRRLLALIETVIEEVLELPEVRILKGDRGRLTSIDNYIIDVLNERIKQTGYPHDALMHGKEKRNTQFPELCEEVFFIFPDGTTLMTTSGQQTQAVDYAVQQEGFISTTNRVYNIPAGSVPLFPDQRALGEGGEPVYKKASGRTIPWDSRQAAEQLYNEHASRYPDGGRSISRRVKTAVRRVTAGQGTARRLYRELLSKSGDTSRGESDAQMDAQSTVSAASDAGAGGAAKTRSGAASDASVRRPVSALTTRTGDSTRTEETAATASEAGDRRHGAGDRKGKGLERRVSSAASSMTARSGQTQDSARTDASAQSIPPQWLLDLVCSTDFQSSREGSARRSSGSSASNSPTWNRAFGDPFFHPASPSQPSGVPQRRPTLGSISEVEPLASVFNTGG